MVQVEWTRLRIPSTDSKVRTTSQSLTPERKVMTLKYDGSLTVVSSSSNVKSYALNETQYIKAETSSKQ